MSVEEDRAIREGRRMTPEEFRAHKAAEKAEQVRGMLAPFEERRAALEARQAHITSELQRLRALPTQSVAIVAQIAELEREWDHSRNQVEARLNTEEGVARKAVANLRP